MKKSSFIVVKRKSSKISKQISLENVRKKTICAFNSLYKSIRVAVWKLFVSYENYVFYMKTAYFQ